MSLLSSLPRLPATLGTTVTMRVLDTKLLALSPAIPLAIVGHCFGFGAIWVFTLGSLGLALLAERVNFLMEQVVYRSGPTVGGFLNATFGNVLELTIAIFALSNHKIDMVEYYLLASIISNILLLLGASLYQGEIVKLRNLQKYDKRQAIVNSYLLLLALLCQLLPIPFRINVVASAAQPKDPSLALSITASMTILIAYFGNLVFQLRRAYNQSSEALDETKVTDMWSGIVWLVGMIALTILLSKYVIETIEDVSNAWVHVNFLTILLSTVCVAARHNGVITSAFANKLRDISLSVVLGSTTQIFTFVVPLCTTIAWLMGIKMELNFNLLGTAFLTLAIVATVFPLLGWLPSFTPDRGFNLSLDFSFSFNLRFLDRISFITDYFTNN